MPSQIFSLEKTMGKIIIFGVLLGLLFGTFLSLVGVPFPWPGGGVMPRWLVAPIWLGVSSAFLPNRLSDAYFCSV